MDVTITLARIPTLNWIVTERNFPQTLKSRGVVLRGEKGQIDRVGWVLKYSRASGKPQ
jgi:hypothetical protein